MDYLDDVQEVTNTEPIDIASERIINELIDPAVTYSLSKEQRSAMSKGIKSIVAEVMGDSLLDIIE